MHWHVMAGLPGYLPNSTATLSNYEDALNALGYELLCFEEAGFHEARRQSHGDVVTMVDLENAAGAVRRVELVGCSERDCGA